MRLWGTSQAPDPTSKLKDSKEIQLFSEREAVRWQMVKREGLEVQVKLLKMIRLGGAALLALVIGMAICSMVGLLHDPESLRVALAASTIASGIWGGIAANLNRRLNRLE
ncbi:MAG TPA: hypothetical protein VF245_02230 [Solirubrobacterales bacterium]